MTRTWPVGGRFSTRAARPLRGRPRRAAAGDRRGDGRAARYRRRPRARVRRRWRRGSWPSASCAAIRSELAADGVVALFFPHGVGHLLGLDVHDMEDLGDRAGYAPGRERATAFGLRSLRLDRDLAAGHGGHDRARLLRRAGDPRAAPTLTRVAGDRLDRQRLEAFADVRGIRIEDDVLVTETGREVLTEAIPKTIAAVEAAMRRLTTIGRPAGLQRPTARGDPPVVRRRTALAGDGRIGGAVCDGTAPRRPPAGEAPGAPISGDGRRAAGLVLAAGLTRRRSGRRPRRWRCWSEARRSPAPPPRRARASRALTPAGDSPGAPRQRSSAAAPNPDRLARSRGGAAMVRDAAGLAVARRPRSRPPRDRGGAVACGGDPAAAARAEARSPPDIGTSAGGDDQGPAPGLAARQSWPMRQGLAPARGDRSLPTNPGAGVGPLVRARWRATEPGRARPNRRSGQPRRTGAASR